MVGVRKADGVYELAVDGTSTTKITGTDANSWQSAWSPDGKKVAVVEIDPTVRTTRDSPSTKLRLVDVTEQRFIDVPTQRADVLMAPSWSADGSSLAYVRHPDADFTREKASLEAIASDGSARRTIVAASSTAAWAPDNSGRIVFSDTEGLKLRDANGAIRVLDRVVDQNTEAWVVNSDGTNAHSIGQSYGPPLWSPSGDQVAIQQNTVLATGFGTVVLVPAAGGPPREVARDGQLVAFFQPIGR